MCSGPYFDDRNGAYSVQWFNGEKWTRTQVYKITGWKKGNPKPKKTPPEAMAQLKVFADKEKAARARGKAIHHETIADFLAAYRDFYRSEQAPGSVKQLDHAIRAFLAWCEGKKARRMDQLAPDVCQAFLDDRARKISQKTGQPLTPGRVHQERALLAAAWARGKKLGQVEAHPWVNTAAPGWQRKKRARQKRPSWTPEQFERLHAAARPWLRDVLTFGTQTGLRINAIVNLQWTDIEWSRDDPRIFGTIRVRAEFDKTGRGYSVPMSPKVHDMLLRRQVHPGSDSQHVLTASRGGKLRTAMCHKQIKATCLRAGLADPPSPNHHMRRTFGRWAVMGHLTGQPIPMYTVMKWLGHSDITTTQHYLDLHDDESQDWMMGRGAGGQLPPALPDGNASSGH